MKKTSSMIPGKLILEDGTSYEGISFGADHSGTGEVVFNTGMVGYPESFTDPSYYGQLLILTYPLVGNYGIPTNTIRDSVSDILESTKIQISGLLVSSYSHDYSHYDAVTSLSGWLKEFNIPALTGIDTRSLTQKLREHGTMPGKIVIDKNITLSDPNTRNLVAEVSPQEIQLLGKGKKRIALIDCGCKHNIIRNLLKRNVEVLRLPWNVNLDKIEYDGLLLSNGPGDPTMCTTTVEQVKKAVKRKKPIFGICLGHQLLALASGAKTYKLKYGHRSQNQPVRQVGSHHCFVTSQNHGYAVDAETLSKEWKPLFENLNDGTNEGMIHESGKFFSVQFHPEAAPGPVDTSMLFDRFIEMVK